MRKYFFDIFVMYMDDYVRTRAIRNILLIRLINLLFLFLFASFPLLFEYCLAYYNNLVSNVVFLTTLFKGVVLCIPLILFNKKIKAILYIYYALVYIPALVNSCHIIIFNADLSNASLLSIFETNFGESIEFFNHFYSVGMVVFVLLYLSIPLLFIRKLSLINFTNIKIDKPLYRRTLLFIFFGTYYGFSFGDARYRYPFERIALAYGEYLFNHIKNVSLYKERKSFHYNNIKSILKTEKSQTYVVVIGESVDKKHMSLYGYDRKTTPHFDTINDELFAFGNVRSAACHTSPALQGVLMFEIFEKGDVVTFLNEAGFKTYWISNQYVSGKFDTVPRMIGNLAMAHVFINKAFFRTNQTPSYDGELLEYVEAALNETHKKKVIFVHLMGSHLPYWRRYPKEYDVFSNINFTERANRVAFYDNSIRYTDDILIKIINSLKSRKNELTIMLYFADHGDDCYDNDSSPHTHHAAIASVHMFDIPVILWVSDKFRKLRDDYLSKVNVSKPYKTDVMIHSILDLFGLEHELIQKKHSLFR